MSRWLVTTLIALPLASAVAFAHGEDKAGPHGGFIRMPGAFHTELVASNGEAGSFKVYLLDIQFKDPVVDKSTVRLTYVPSRGKPVEATCAPAGDHFQCTIAGYPKTPKGKIVIDASRQGLPSTAAEYALPLKLGANAAPPMGGHEHHGAH